METLMNGPHNTQVILQFAYVQDSGGLSAMNDQK